MEKIKLVTKERIGHLTNSFDEKLHDYLREKTFIFEPGKIYGIIGEQNEGGETLSAILSGRISIKEEIFYCDGMEIDGAEIQNMGWYVGKSEYSNGIIKREISARKALISAIKKYHCYNNIDEIIEDFHLTPNRLDYELSKYSGEGWRVSLAIGYACKKKIFCFSWMNTTRFSGIILSSGVFRFFKRLKKEGCIIILPTSRKENVEGFVDEVIEVYTPQEINIITNNPYFIEHY